MNRRERILSLVSVLDECADRFCTRTDGTYVEHESQYKGKEDIERLKFRRVFVFYNSFMAEFKYTAHAPFGVVSSILECLIHTDKNQNGCSIPLAMLLDYCGIETSLPLCIPGILDPNGMREAFALIGGVLERNMKIISEMLGNEDRRGKVEHAFFAEVSALYNTKIDENNIMYYSNDGFFSVFTLRFCASAFINYIKGNTKNAIKQMRKTKNKLGYEKRVLTLWEKGETIDPSCLSNVLEGLEAYNKSGVATGVNKKEMAAMFLSWLVLTVLFSFGYLGLFFLLFAIESIDAFYLMGPIYNVPYCILAAFLTAIPASYFMRFKIYRRLFAKDYERLRAFDQVHNGKSGDKLIKGMLHVILICSLVGTILFTRWGVKFLDDGFVDNTAFFSVKGQYYEYEDIDRVYYMPNRVNGFGETLEFPSYVLVLKDGKEIDLYQYDDVEKYENILIHHLKEKGVRVDMDACKKE